MAIAVGAFACREDGGEDRPVDEPRQQPANSCNQHHGGDAVAPAREQVATHPAERAGLGGGRGEVGAFGGYVGHGQRSVSAMRLLYQFMNSEMDRLTVRYAAMMISTFSIA